MRARALAALAALAFLSLLGAAPASATAPWWQLSGGSRPSNLRVAPDQTEVQELSTAPFAPATSSEGEGEIFAARVEVGGQAIGCLGAGELQISIFHITAAEQCESKTGFPASEDAAQLAQMLEEGPYGEGVQVSGGKVGQAAFQVATPGRWVPPVKLTPLTYKPPIGELEVILGSASVEVASKGSGRLVAIATNLGDAPLDATSAPLSFEASLPAGVQAYGVEAFAGAQGSAGAVDCAVTQTEPQSRIECSFEGLLPSYEALEVEIPVALKPGAGSGAGEIALTGGEAPGGAPAPSAHAPLAVNVSGAPIPFGLEAFSARAEAEGGAEVTQAGVHPFQMTFLVQPFAGPLKGASNRREATIEQPAQPREVRVTLPAGLVGSATAVPACPMADFLNVFPDTTDACPPQSAVGVASVTVVEPTFFGLLRLAVPIFSLTPARGEPARFGFAPVGVPVAIDTAVDPSDSYRITAGVRNITQVAQFVSATTTLWGVPGDPRHDSSRGWGCVLYTHPSACGSEAGEANGQTPLLTMPASCGHPLGADAVLEAWGASVGAAFAHADGAPLGACNQVPFDPAISNALTSKLASNPSGLDLGIQMPDSGLENPKDGAVSEAQFKRAEVTFPRGVTVNPSIAEGLAVCSEAQYDAERYDSAPGEGCPQASKIGSVAIATPLLEEQAEGSVYQATPYENKTKSLIGLYLIAKIPDRGILVKQPIEVRPDPQSGRLVSVAENVPQLPFSSFRFHFREGGRSPLITPPGCGTFNTVAKFTPWSAADPDNPAPSEVVERQASFTIERGVDGGACPSGPAPFHPGFEAGTLNNQAGSYSPFLMHLTRNDGEQDMGKFSFVLPPGVVGKLAGIPYCPEAGIARAQSRQGAHGGQEEHSDPSCPAASQIGTTVGGAGVGNQLTYVSGTLYLAGPWHGDPLSVVAITPAVAGPFDAGTVVVREALRLNPITARAEVDGAASDPIPHILKGIPLNLRDLRVYADRPDFTLNATSCEPLAGPIDDLGRRHRPGTARADPGRPLQPLPGRGLRLPGLQAQAGDLSSRAAPSAAPSRPCGRSYDPAPGEANFSRAAVTLPHSAFLEQAHFRTICTRVQFAAGAGHGSHCPKGARSTATPRPGARCSTARPRAPSTCAPPTTTCPTSSSPSRAPPPLRSTSSSPRASTRSRAASARSSPASPTFRSAASSWLCRAARRA